MITEIALVDWTFVAVIIKVFVTWRFATIRFEKDTTPFGADRFPLIVVVGPVTVSEETFRVPTLALVAVRLVVKEFRFEIEKTFRVPTLAVVTVRLVVTEFATTRFERNPPSPL